MDRKKGIGGTDISAIVGMNPFKTPLDVWLDKTGQKEETPDNENLWWGREMEPVLAKRYCKERDWPEEALLLPPILVNPMIHKDNPWYLGSPDAIIPRSGRAKRINIEGGVDFKTSGKPDEWGEPGTDEVPQHYLIQAEWYMGLTGAQWWDIAVLLMSFTRKFAIYRINRDDELIEGLTEAGAKFWQDHVLANVPPPLDGSKSATEYLKRKYPQDSGPMIEPTDEFIIEQIFRYQVAKESLKAWEEVAKEKENYLKDIIGDCAGMQGDWGRLTWKKNRDSIVIDTKAMIAAYPDIAEKFKITKPGARVFRVNFNDAKR